MKTVYTLARTITIDNSEVLEIIYKDISEKNLLVMKSAYEKCCDIYTDNQNFEKNKHFLNEKCKEFTVEETITNNELYKMWCRKDIILQNVIFE